MSDSHVLRAHGLHKSYYQGNHAIEVLRDVSIEIRHAQQLAIVGSSGCGKSTLLHLLAGLDSADQGEVQFGGYQLSSLSAKARGFLRNDMLGFVYQFHHLLPEFSALENVAMPLLVGRTSPAAARESAQWLLERVGLEDRMQHKPAELSGGERQRAAIARALVASPQLVLADEPTGNLDESTAERVYDLMLELNEEIGTAFLVVTHDPVLASRMQRVYHLTSGVLHLQS